MLYTYIILRNQHDHPYFILWLLANFYMNDQCKNIQWPFSQNTDFRLNTLLHGALQLVVQFCIRIPIRVYQANKILYYIFWFLVCIYPCFSNSSIDRYFFIFKIYAQNSVAKQLFMFINHYIHIQLHETPESRHAYCANTIHKVQNRNDIHKYIQLYSL